MTQPHLVLLDMKDQVREFRACVYNVYPTDDFLIHTLYSMVESLESWKITEDVLLSIVEDIIHTYGMDRDNEEIRPVVAVMLELIKSFIHQVEHHQLLDKKMFMFYEFHQLIGDDLVLVSTN
jgi:hypothetical protein